MAPPFLLVFKQAANANLNQAKYLMRSVSTCKVWKDSRLKRIECSRSSMKVQNRSALRTHAATGSSGRARSVFCSRSGSYGRCQQFILWMASAPTQRLTRTDVHVKSFNVMDAHYFPSVSKQVSREATMAFGTRVMQSEELHHCVMKVWDDKKSGWCCSGLHSQSSNNLCRDGVWRWK